MSYEGCCIDIIDTTGLFSDATEMAQCVENSVKISHEDFKKTKFVADVGEPETHEISYNEDYDLIIVYIVNEDIHHFWSHP